MGELCELGDPPRAPKSTHPATAAAALVRDGSTFAELSSLSTSAHLHSATFALSHRIPPSARLPLLLSVSFSDCLPGCESSGDVSVCLSSPLRQTSTGALVQSALDVVGGLPF